MRHLKSAVELNYFLEEFHLPSSGGKLNFNAHVNIFQKGYLQSISSEIGVDMNGGLPVLHMLNFANKKLQLPQFFEAIKLDFLSVPGKGLRITGLNEQGEYVISISPFTR